MSSLDIASVSKDDRVSLGGGYPEKIPSVNNNNINAIGIITVLIVKNRTDTLKSDRS